MRLWWLSFVDEGRLLGACIVECDGLPEQEARNRGCHPGGEMYFQPFPPAAHLNGAGRAFLDRAPRNTLLSRSEWDAIGAETATLGEVRMLEEIPEAEGC